MEFHSKTLLQFPPKKLPLAVVGALVQTLCGAHGRGGHGGEGAILAIAAATTATQR